jgi:hypothetical protein
LAVSRHLCELERAACQPLCINAHTPSSVSLAIVPRPRRFTVWCIFVPCRRGVLQACLHRVLTCACGVSQACLHSVLTCSCGVSQACLHRVLIYPCGMLQACVHRVLTCPCVVVQVFALLTTLTAALVATKADSAAVHQRRLQLQRQLVSPAVAAYLVEVLDFCLLVPQDSSSQQLPVRDANSTYFR